MGIAELDVPMDEVADRLHARPAGRAVAEVPPGNVGEQIRLAVAAAQQVDQRGLGQVWTGTCTASAATTSGRPLS